MKEQRKVPFEYIEEAREAAGFFVRDVCKNLGITERSYYRWRASGYGPSWVYKCLKILSGELDYFGWKGWYICNGVLYKRDFNPKYYNKTAGELAADWYLSALPKIKSGFSKQDEMKNAGIQGSNFDKRVQGSGKGRVIAIEQGMEARRRRGIQSGTLLPGNGLQGGKKDRETIG